jgi:hypothetical protein
MRRKFAPMVEERTIMSPSQSVLWLLTAQGFLGAFDTIYFHELRARLPALQTRAKSELVLHSLQSLIYGHLRWRTTHHRTGRIELSISEMENHT